MQLGMVGVGKMGGNMVRRLLPEHDVVIFDREPSAMTDLQGMGAVGTYSLEGLVEHLAGPRVVWVMVPAGRATEMTIDELAGLLAPGDVIIDGGSTNWRDDARRHAALAQRGIHYIDVGVPEGKRGQHSGYCMMVGGDEAAIMLVAPILDTLAPCPEPKHGPGWLHVGPVGAGRYVNKVHSSITFGMMRAIADGFRALDHSDFEVDLAGVAHLWMRGGTARSLLLELLASALDQEGDDPAGGEGQAVGLDVGSDRMAMEAIRVRASAHLVVSLLLARYGPREG